MPVRYIKNVIRAAANIASPYAELDRALETYYRVNKVDYPIGLDDRFRYASSSDLMADPEACDHLKQIARNAATIEKFSQGNTLPERAISVGMPIDVYESVMNLQKSTVAVGNSNGWNLLT